MSNLFNNFIFEPILSVLVWIYQNFSFVDLGIAIIIFTVLLRFVLLPFFYRSSMDQALIRKLQPKVDEIKKKHKDNKEMQGKELLALYKEHKINPASGFLLLIIQLPIFFALFKIFKDPVLITETFSHVNSLGIINLIEASVLLAVVAAVIQYIQGKISLAVTKNSSQKNNPMAKIGNSMVYLAPVLSFIVLIKLPSALALYWITSSLFSTVQQIVINKKIAEMDFKTKKPAKRVEAEVKEVKEVKEIEEKKEN